MKKNFFLIRYSKNEKNDVFFHEKNSFLLP